MPTAYEDALQLLVGTGPEYGDGLANCGSIVADGLVELGRPHLVRDWIREYSQRLEAMPAAVTPISRENWQPALGDQARMGDWVNFFNREIHRSDWRTILSDWLPRLVPGMAGGAGFGCLRTAHAIRNLNLDEIPGSIEELGQGLGYWASYYLKLPGILGGGASSDLTPVEALSHIKWQHKQRPPEFDSVSRGLSGLSRFSPFAGVMNLVHIPGNPADLITEITAAMARVFLSNMDEPKKRVPFMQSVILPSALRHLCPQVEPELAVTLCRFGWQFAGAMYAIYGRVNPADSWESPGKNRESLIDQACSSGDGFAIMFTAACLREFSLNPDPAYLAAATAYLQSLAAPPAAT